jgi:hypothetical protein
VAKGGQFERDLCRQLTRWWTGDPDHDVLFWRTSQSGGRVTSRAKRGQKSTAAHCGDISALDERGAPLTRLITFEAKNGYSAATIHAVLDHPSGTPVPKKDNYPNWIAQAVTAAGHARTPFWAIVHHRPKRADLITFPAALWDHLGCTVRTVDPPILHATIEVRIGLNYRILDLTAVTLDAFLDGVTPAEIRRLYGVMSKCPPIPASASSVPCASGIDSLRR